MSTEHIREEAEAARRTLGQLARRVAERRRDVQRELQGFDTETDNVLTGARGALRAIEDDREVALEELGQLDEILNPPDDTPEPPAAPPVPPTPPTAPQPPVTPEPPVVTPEPVPVPVDEPEPADGATQVNVFVTFIHWVQGWTPIGWLLAIFGAVLGLLVANATKGTFDDIVGFGRGMLVFFWFVFVTGLGFCVGGLLGSLFNRSTE